MALCDSAAGTGTVPTTRGLLLCPAMPGEVHCIYLVCAPICFHICMGVSGRCFLGGEAVDIVRFSRELPPPLAGPWGSSRLHPMGGGGFNPGVRQLGKSDLCFWAAVLHLLQTSPRQRQDGARGVPITRLSTTRQAT